MKLSLKTVTITVNQQPLQKKDRQTQKWTVEIVAEDELSEANTVFPKHLLFETVLYPDSHNKWWSYMTYWVNLKFDKATNLDHRVWEFILQNHYLEPYDNPFWEN